MLITTIFIFPLLSHQNQISIDKKLQLPLYKENLIDIIDEQGYIYKYNISIDKEIFTKFTYCQVKPQSLDIKIEHKLKVTHKTSQYFERNFGSGKLKSQTEFIQSAVINHYGIIILTSDKNLTFVPHQDINGEFVQSQHFEIYESVENSYLIYIEERNLLILLLQSNIVYEYEISHSTNTYNNIQFKNNYKQETIKIDQIQMIKVYSKYIFILFWDGCLLICNSKMEWIHKFKNVRYFEFEIISEQFRLYLLQQNGTLMYQIFQFNDKTIVIDNKQQVLITQSNAVSFKLYKEGILIVIENKNEGYIITDYLYDIENSKEINSQTINYKIKQIIIHDYYAILIGEKTSSVITIGIDRVYLNQQNYKVQQNLPITQILDVLMFSETTQNGLREYIYVYTKTSFLKLNLQAGKFEIICNCQSREEAKKSPYYYELEYYNSKCGGCQKRKKYQLYFTYAIITKEDELKIIIATIIIVTLIMVGVIGWIYKYLEYIKRQKEFQKVEIIYKNVNEQEIKLETINTKRQYNNYSMNDSSIHAHL